MEAARFVEFLLEVPLRNHKQLNLNFILNNIPS